MISIDTRPAGRNSQRTCSTLLTSSGLVESSMSPPLPRNGIPLKPSALTTRSISFMSALLEA